MRPRFTPAGPKHRCGRPPAVVEARALPADGYRRSVDVLGVVDLVPFEIALGPGQPRPVAHPPRPVGDNQLRRTVAVEDRHLHDAPWMPGGVAFRRPLPAVEQRHGVRAPGGQKRGDVKGLVVLGVGVTVGLALARPGAVDVQLVLLVSRDVGPRPDDGRGTECDFLANVCVLVRLQARGPPDPLGLPISVPQPGLERRARGERPRSARRRPGLHGPPVGGVGCQSGARIGDERLRSAAHSSAVPHRAGRTGASTGDSQARHDQPVGAL